MSSTPLFTDPQFLDATAPGGLTPSFGVVSGSVASVGSGIWAAPGLLAPETMTVSFSGMTATIGLPSPWGVVSSGGVVVRAHGASTGVDTQNYSVSFTSLIPASGSIVAYLAASVTTISQNPVPIPGPPPGHSAFDPNFVPTVGYTKNVYSVALSAVTGGIDNTSLFELLRTTLTAGQSAISTYSTIGQFRAPDRDAWPAETLTSGGVLSPSQAQIMLTFAASGVTVTMPPTSGAGGLMFGFVNPLAVTGTVATAGSDLLAGFSAVSGVSSIVVPSLASLLLWGNAAQGRWQVLAASPNTTPSGYTEIDAVGAFTFTVPADVFEIDAAISGGGGGGGASNFPTVTQAGAGGGGGGYCRKKIPVLPGQVYSGTVGSGGVGGTVGGTTGGNNGSGTGFLGMVAGGGGGGTGWLSGASIGGAGGAATGGDENVAGGTGSAGGTVANSIGGTGGGSPNGGGGGGTSTGTPYAGTFPGGGGGGGGSGGAADGAAGANGRVVIRWPA